MDLSPIDITTNPHTGEPIYWYSLEQYFFIRNRHFTTNGRDRGSREGTFDNPHAVFKPSKSTPKL